MLYCNLPYEVISDECGKKVQKMFDKETWAYHCMYKKKWFIKDLCKNCKYNKARRYYGY